MIVRLKLSNIGSYEDAFFTFGEGKNVIVGENGSGKTTLLKAIAFGLFGSTKIIGDLNLADFLREGEDSGSVEMVFTDATRKSRHRIERVITRSGDRASSSATLWIDEARKLTGVTAVNDEVKRLLGIDAKLWSETTYGKQGQISAILDGKKDVFDRMIGVDVYEDAWRAMRAVHSKFGSDQRSAEATVSELKALISGKEETTKRIGDAKTDLASYEREYDLNGGNESGSIENFNEINGKITELRERKSVLESKIDDNNDMMAKIRDLETCPTCLQPVDATHKDRITSGCHDKVVDLQGQRDLLDQEISVMTTEREGVEGVLKNLERVSELRGRIVSFRDHVIPELEGKIKMITDAESKIADLEAKSARNKKVEAVATQVRDVLRAVQPRIRKARVRQIQQTTVDTFNDLFGDNYDALVIDPISLLIKIEKGGEERRVSVMSGGERVGLGISMRIAIAKEIGRQDMLILDEPMGQLDHARKTQLIDLLENLTIDTQLIMVTHDELLEGAADVLVRIKKTKDGSVPQVIAM